MQPKHFVLTALIALASVMFVGTLSAQPYTSSAIPTMSQTEIDALVNPEPGFIVYNTTTGEIQINTGSSETPDWTSGGGSGTVNGTGTGTQVAYWTPEGGDATELTSSPNLDWDPVNSRLNIGQGTPATPGDQLVVDGSATFRGDQVLVDGNLVVTGNLDVQGSGSQIGSSSDANQLHIRGDGSGDWEHLLVTGNTRVSRQLRVGNYDAIGTPGSPQNGINVLDVNGNAQFRGDQVVIDGNLVVHGDLTVNGRLRANDRFNQIGDGTDSEQLRIVGDGSGTTDHLYVQGNARITRNLRVDNEARFYNGSFYSSFQAGTQSANISYTLPTTAPTAGQVLSSDASGNLSWVAPSVSFAYRGGLTGSITALASDNILGVDVSGGAATVTLPLASSVPGGHIIVVNVEEGDSFTNNVTIERSGSDTVDGNTSITIFLNKGQYILYSNGTDAWHSIENPPTI